MTDAFRSAAAIADDVQAGNVDPVGVIEETLERIDERRDRTNAFITVLPDEARERARAVRDRVAAGEDLPLAGVPLGIKDLGQTKADVRSTHGLAPLADNVAEATSIEVTRLEAAGAVVVGTTSTPAMGHTVRTFNDLVGETGTPFDPDYNAGGSSGGSAAALADGLCALATGSDVGGSLRTPASCCSVLSVKPSHGLVPNASAVNGFASHTPVAVQGPMARDTESLARMLDVMAGPHPVDPFSVPTPVTYADALAGPVDPADFEVAYSPDLDLFPVDPAVRESVESTLDDLERAGATVDRVSLDTPDRETVNRTYRNVVTTYFAKSVEALNRDLGVDLVDAHGEDLPDILVAMVQLGEGQNVTDYAYADFPRTELYHAVETVVGEYDALVSPTLAAPPLTHEEPYPPEIDGEETNGLATDWALGWVFNLTGHPVVNVPAAPANGLPVGMQAVGSRFAESRLLELAAAVEGVSPWAYPDA